MLKVRRNKKEKEEERNNIFRVFPFTINFDCVLHKHDVSVKDTLLSCNTCNTCMTTVFMTSPPHKRNDDLVILKNLKGKKEINVTNDRR